MKKTLNKITNKIKDLRNINYKEYIKNNTMFFAVLITAVVNSLLLRTFTIGNFFELKPIIGDIAIVLILCSFGYIFKPKKQIVYYFTLSVILTAICTINCMYYTFYSSFTSISLLATSLQVSHVSDALVKNVLQYKDFTFLWQPIFILILHNRLKHKGYYSKSNFMENSKKRFTGSLIAAGIVLSLFVATLSELEVGRLVKQWNREFLVAKFGVYIYQANDIVASLEPRINTIFGYDKSIQNVRNYYENREVINKTNEYTNIFAGKNVIMIHAESIQQFLVDLKFNGNEVTPILNKLSSEGLYFSNFYAQVGVGTSSDTEFTLSTSLLPVQTGTVFIGYWDRTYVAIPQLLKEKGYYTFSMHGNNGTFWNRIVMHEKLGYDKFYHQSYYNIDEKIGLGLSDKSFFKQSIPIIKEVSEEHKNFYTTLIMLTNHTPFDETDQYGEFPVTMKVEIENEYGVKEEVERPYMEDTIMGNYMKSAHYADSAIGEFLDGLDKEGLLDNTVVVIYGDHDARLSKKDYTRFYNYDPYTDTVLDQDDPNYKEIDYYTYELNRKVPLIIWSKDQKLQKKVDKVMGMYDILPTLGNMLGFSSEYALGNDIFNVDDNTVVFSNGNWLTNKIYYNSQKQEYLPLTNEVISESYIDERVKKAETLISVSNDLIVYDYIKHKNETEKLKKDILK